MKKTGKGLKLNRETVANLSKQQLGGVQGGGETGYSVCYGTCASACHSCISQCLCPIPTERGCPSPT
jgi:hypothetical protein